MQKPKTTIQPDPQHEVLEAKVDAMMDINGQARASEPVDVVPSAPLVPRAHKVSEPVLNDIRTTQPAPTDETLAASPDVFIEPLRIDTPQTDAAIDDIVAQEADEVLAAQDAGIEAAIEAANDFEPPQKHGHPIFWFFVILLVIIIAVIVVILTSPGLSPSFAP